jgi:broad specificity phosphatase PhoE
MHMNTNTAMKWPEWIMLVRHDVSEYNLLKKQQVADPDYRKFQREFEKDSASPQCVGLAGEMARRFQLRSGDVRTMLVDPEARRAERTGAALAKKFAVPDIVFVSPYLRTEMTLAGIVKGWPELKRVRVVREERIREQEHGLASLYNDWRVFQTLHPEQKLLHARDGRYWYRYPQGENVPDVRDRNRSFLNTLTRDFSGRRVLVVTHLLNILAMRANLDRLDEKEFLRLDEEEAPVNLSVTLYRGDPAQGAKGKLVLDFYNRKYH